MAQLSGRVDAALHPDLIDRAHQLAAWGLLRQAVTRLDERFPHELAGLDAGLRAAYRARRDALAAAVAAAVNDSGAGSGSSTLAARYRVWHRFYPDMLALLAEVTAGARLPLGPQRQAVETLMHAAGWGRPPDSGDLRAWNDLASWAYALDGGDAAGWALAFTRARTLLVGRVQATALAG
jgi:hypothetical protein